MAMECSATLRSGESSNFVLITREIIEKFNEVMLIFVRNFCSLWYLEESLWNHY